MVTIDQAITAKIVKKGKHFEILVDPTLAYDLKDGKTVSLNKLLAVNAIFTDARKGEKVSDKDLEEAFSTRDIEKVAEHIVKHGEVQLTTELRRKKVVEKKKQIAALISRYAIDPRTKVPHPQERILAVMDQGKVNIDPFKPAEQQIEDVMKSIKMIIPISMEETSITAEIPARYSGHAYGVLKEFGKIEKDRWLNDGTLVVTVRMPAGIKENFFRIMNSITEGNVKITER